VIRAIRSETVKLLSVRLWWVLAIILFVYVGFMAALLAFAFGSAGDGAGPPDPTQPQLDPAALPPLIYSLATAVGYVIPLILGTLSSTGEVRYQTLTPTFLAQPKRGVVLGAKLIVNAVAGVVLGAVALLASIGAGAGVLAAVGLDPQLGERDTWLLVARIVLAMAIWALVGVGLGSLIPNQIAAIIVVLAFTQFLEPILRLVAGFIDWLAPVGRFLPGAASDALVGSSIFTSLPGLGASTDPLTWWQGGLVLLGYAAVITVLGWLTTWRRDIT
jgi:ABC-2 type transport system permease protein